MRAITRLFGSSPLMNSTSTRMARYWINQPSTLQPDHAFHGQNVLAPADLRGLPNGVVDRCYFATGPVICAQIFALSLSPGWKMSREDNYVAGLGTSSDRATVIVDASGQPV